MRTWQRVNPDVCTTCKVAITNENRVIYWKGRCKSCVSTYFHNRRSKEGKHTPKPREVVAQNHHEPDIKTERKLIYTAGPLKDVFIYRDMMYHAKCCTKIYSSGVQYATEAVFVCEFCHEAIYIPLVAADRIEVRDELPISA